MTHTEQYITECLLGLVAIASLSVVSFAVWGCP
jgi:hypothetical protein